MRQAKRSVPRWLYAAALSLLLAAVSGTMVATGPTSVAQANAAPTADDKNVRSNQNAALKFLLSAADAEDCELTFSIVDRPSSGSLSDFTQQICRSDAPNVDWVFVTYTPAPDFSGTDTFTYKVTDSGGLDSNTATVRVEVIGWVVTRSEDSDDGSCDAHCSLREAIASASSGDVILVPEATYTLILGTELVIDKSLVLIGDGAATTIVQAATSRVASKSRILKITGGNVAISGFTIRHGVTSGDGGGIWNGGTLTLTRVTLFHNFADSDGGGIWNSGTLILAPAAVSDSSAGNVGGGIWNSGTLTMAHGSIVNRNSAGSVGGGIWNSGTLTMAGTSVENNSAVPHGGGIWNGGTLGLTGSSVDGNSTLFSGGIANEGTLTLTGSRVSGNVATGAHGGGIRNGSGSTLVLTNTTVNGNTAATSRLRKNSCSRCIRGSSGIK